MRVFARPLIAAVLALALSACGKGASIDVTPDDMQMGKADAKVTVVEYASASCPHCAVFNNTDMPQLKAQYIDTGKVHYVFREFLTPPLSFASAGFLMARCAGKDRYFGVLDAIYRAQEDIYKSNDIRGGLLQIAMAAGMNEEQFDKCISDKKEIADLNDRVKLYQDKAKIEGTPTFVINGVTIMDGLTPEFKNVAAGIEAAIAGKDINAAAKAAK